MKDTETFSEAEHIQKQHFDSIASLYTAHFGDTWSQRYRWEFINGPMLGDVELSGLRVLDAMCGSGETTGYLLAGGALVTGLDMSEEQTLQFQQRFPGCGVHCASILSTGLESNSFDCVAVVGGLHHIHPHCSSAITEIHRVLKPGGLFCFTEPHTGSLPDLARRFWYSRDRLFAENEAAIDLEALKQEFASRFTFLKEEYGGNIAYLLVLNSLVFRIPLRMKRIYSPFLIRIEALLSRIQGKLLSCFVVCRWKKHN